MTTPVKTNAYGNYQHVLGHWPESGSGQRLVNRHVLRVARLACQEGISPENAAQDIASAMLKHTRAPHPGEIERAMEKVFGESVNGMGAPKIVSAPPAPALATFQAYAAEGVAMGFSETDLRNPSPERMPGSEGGYRIEWEYELLDAIAFLLGLFRPDDWVMCLPTLDTRAEANRDVRLRDDWLHEFVRLEKMNLPLPAFVAPNPIKPVSEWGRSPTDGRPSPRVQESVAAFRHLVLERDANPLNDRKLAVATQIAFLGGWGLRFGWQRVRAVTYTGNKSLHVLLDVDVPDKATWDRDVAHGLLSEFVRMGFDGSFANPAQMCRLPGAWRRLTDKQLEDGDRTADGAIPETKRRVRQRLLFIRLEGGHHDA